MKDRVTENKRESQDTNYLKSVNQVNGRHGESNNLKDFYGCGRKTGSLIQ